MLFESIIVLCALTCPVYLQPLPWPSLDGYPIEADCMAIFGRQQVFPIVGLETEAEPAFELTRHHIIPVNTLRDFFNAAVQQNNRGEGNVELSGIMNLFGFLSNDTLNRYIDVQPAALRNQIFLDLQSAVRLQELYSLGENPPLNRLFDSRVLVGSMFIWMPRNVFIGPTYRSDDPGPAFDAAAGYIIDSELFGRLQTINRMMRYYINNRERATFNEIMELLSEIAQEEGRPHPYREEDWEVSGTRTSRRGNQITEYRVRRDRQRRHARDVSPETKLINKDPYCIVPIERVKAILRDKNLVIATMIVERARSNKGFYTRNYASWKDWYDGSSWEAVFNNGIYGVGCSMAGVGLIYKPYGYIFTDGSAAVGIIGKDAAFGKDNWTHQTNWMYGDATEYCGQMFFDKKKRPVAIAITTKTEASLGAGWSFVYKDGAWEYHSTDDWDQQYFQTSTLSLDPSAIRFSIIPRDQKTEL